MIKKIKTNKALYFMLLPCVAYTFLFSYYPLTGWIMAFQNFKPARGYKARLHRPPESHGTYAPSLRHFP